MSYLDSVVVGVWSLTDVVRTYINIENYISNKENKDTAFGERENFPVPFTLIKVAHGGQISSITGFPYTNVIQIDSSFLSLDKSSQRFLLLRQCGHLEHWNTHVKMIATIVIAVSAIVLFPGAPFFGYLGLSAIVPTIINAIQERRADFYAIDHAKLEELEGGLAFYKELQEKIPVLDPSEWDEDEYNENIHALVEVVLSYVHGHPFPRTRIALIENTIEARKNRNAMEVLV